MNVSAKHKTKIPWRRIIPVALVLLVLGYTASRPTLERWFNIALPAITDDDRRRDTAGSDNDYQVTLPNNSSNSSPTSATSATGGKFQLKEIGRDRYQTPAGLLYTMGSRGEHRIEHVMRHAQDQPNRHAHGVFIGNGDQDAVLQIIDDAYELVKSKSPRAKYESSKGNDKYDVDMQRKVGFEGGKKGQRSNNRALNKVRMILDDNRVITAFPVR